MFLEYGLNQHGEMIHIEQAARGLGDLVCPYCQGQLIARKGSEKIHHFAHAGETCREVADRDNSVFKLPYYDKFDLGLSPRKLAFLFALKENRYADETEGIIYDLEQGGFIKQGWKVGALQSDFYEPTHLGKIPYGGATLEKFAEIQLARLLDRHKEISLIVSRAWNNIQYSRGEIKRINHAPMPSWLTETGIENHRISNEREIRLEQENIYKNEAKIKHALIDLNIYRAQLRRVFAASLYFLEIKHSWGVLYKVGITNRLEGRIEEIRRDLAPHLSGVEINVLRQLQHRGAIEFYFKHRYKENQHRLGSLTEYFSFEDRKKVLSDISKLGDYAPDDFMLAILNNEPSAIEREIEEETQRTIEEARQAAIREAHRAKTKEGMLAAAAQGIHIGRPKDEAEGILAKYPQVVAMLEEGRPIRTIARETGINKNTVKKVREAINQAIANIEAE